MKSHQNYAACFSTQSTFLALELLLTLLFGVSFLLPVVLVMLNLAGVLTAG